MKTLLVTGTDTDVGKTFVSCLMVTELRRSGIRVGVYKPACSGAESSTGDLVWHDVAALGDAAGGQYSDDEICPQRFTAPLAPNVAARQEGRVVDDALLREGARRWKDRCDLLLVEGAGGLLCPLSDRSTVRDLAVDLEASLFVVAANRLGVVNHTLLTLEVAAAAGLPVRAVVLNEMKECEAGDQSPPLNAALLKQFAPEVPMLHCGYGASLLADAHGSPVDLSALLPTI